MSHLKKMTLFCILVPVLTALLPMTAWAETDQTSYKICGHLRDSAHQWSWETIEKRYADELMAGEYQKVSRAMLMALGTSKKQQDRQIQEKAYAKLAEVVDQKANGRVLFDIYVEIPQDLHKTKRYYLFYGDPGQIDLQDCGPNNERAEQLDELRYFAHAVVNLSDMETSPARQQAVERIRKLEVSYDRYLFEGFPMFPWEAAINSAFLTKDNISDGPPRNQLLFLHLGAGFEINTESMSRSELGVAVSVEPFGWIHYPVDEEYRSWWGIAALTTFRNDMGMGIGFALHYNEFSLGATWHKKDTPGSHYGQPFLFIGIDLYRYLDSNKRHYDQYVSKYRALKEQYLKENK